MTRIRRMIVGCVAVLLAGSAGATTLLRMDIHQMTAAAAWVVRARCIASESRWEQGHVWTFTRFEALETLKGRGPAQFTVRLVGGKAGSLTSTVEGVPRFRPGEEVFLFLTATPVGDHTVVGWAQGTFRVQREAGRETVMQDTAGATLFDPATREFTRGGARGMPVSELRRAVAAAVQRQSGRQP
jgi:hypothetical protein